MSLTTKKVLDEMKASYQRSLSLAKKHPTFMDNEQFTSNLDELKKGIAEYEKKLSAETGSKSPGVRASKKRKPLRTNRRKKEVKPRTSERPKNLAELKRYILNKKVYFLLDGVWIARQCAKVGTDYFAFESHRPEGGYSWLYFKNASEFKFDNKGFNVVSTPTENLKTRTLQYRYEKPQPETKKQAPKAKPVTRTQKKKCNRKAVKQTGCDNRLTARPDWYVVINRFLRSLEGKERTNNTLRKFLEDMQNRFDARKGQDTPHIASIRYIQGRVISALNSGLTKKKLTVTASAAEKKKMLIALESVKFKRVKTKPKVQKVGLSGVPEMNISEPISDITILDGNSLMNVEFPKIGLTGDYLKVIGDAQDNAVIMLKGRRGGGKSTFAMQVAAHLVNDLNKNVIYVAIEEGFSDTLKDKIRRTKAGKVHFVESLNDVSNFADYDFVVLDSVTSSGLSYEDLKEQIGEGSDKKYQNTGFLLVYQQKENGEAYGGNKHGHLADVILQFDDGICRTEKSRYGGNGEIKVY